MPPIDSLTLQEQLEHAHQLLEHAQTAYDTYSDGRAHSLAMLSIASSLFVIAYQLVNGSTTVQAVRP